MAAISPEAEAVYFAALGSLQDLSLEEQGLVVMNWVKYFIVVRTKEQTPMSSSSFQQEFGGHCLDFGMQVMMLPETVPLVDQGPCGNPNCPSCRAAKMTRATH